MPTKACQFPYAAHSSLEGGISKQCGGDEGPEIRVILDLVAEWPDFAGGAREKSRRLLG